jgi:thiamine kinase-like enzyme
MLIDYEYGGWNPMAMDLANYMNETMLDNAYPGKNGVAWYEENCMTPAELEKMAVRYLECYYSKYATKEVVGEFESAEDFIGQKLPDFLQDIWNCALLNNLFWGCWSLQLLSPEEFTKEGIFNYDFAQSRIALYK